MVLGLAEPTRPVLDRLGNTVVGLRYGFKVGQIVGDVDLPVGGGGIPFYRLIMFTAMAQHAVVALIPGLVDVSVGYMSDDIGGRIPGRGA